MALDWQDTQWLSLDEPNEFMTQLCNVIYWKMARFVSTAFSALRCVTYIIGNHEMKIVLIFCSEPTLFIRSSDSIAIILVKINHQPEAKKEASKVTFPGF